MQVYAFGSYWGNERIDTKYKLLYLIASYFAIQAEHTPSQKTVDARKEGMFHRKIISSHLMDKAVNNYS